VSNYDPDQLDRVEAALRSVITTAEAQLSTIVQRREEILTTLSVDNVERTFHPWPVAIISCLNKYHKAVGDFLYDPDHDD